ncbi:MAG: hypothetical protein K5986_02590 [Clostridium sp.]|nr:hypothetical protein [Clostridium sp.]
MWYVVQTRTGEEEKIKQIIGKLKSLDKDAVCFTPTYEGVKRSGGKNRIYLAALFPGYIFVDTKHPEKILDAQSKMTEFIKLLGVENNEEGIVITPVSNEEKKFIKSLIDDDYLMHVSLVKLNEKHKIESIVGPLEQYWDKIVKMEYRKRRAIVETEIFGHKHRILFGLWGYEDPARDNIFVQNS